MTWRRFWTKKGWASAQTASKPKADAAGVCDPVVATSQVAASETCGRSEYVYLIEDTMILTIKGKDEFVCTIDAADYALVKGRRWSASMNKNCVYVRSGKTSLHRLVAGAKPGEMVDHINGNGLGNRRCNLRIVSHQANKANQHHGTSRKTSRYIGVSKKRNTFQVSMKIGGKNTHCGTFADEIAAAQRYDALARQIHGANAATNF